MKIGRLTMKVLVCYLTIHDDDGVVKLHFQQVNNTLTRTTVN